MARRPRPASLCVRCDAKEEYISGLCRSCLEPAWGAKRAAEAAEKEGERAAEAARAEELRRERAEAAESVRAWLAKKRRS